MFNKPIISSLLANERLTAEDHWQDTRKISLCCPSDYKYAPGDIAMI